MRNRQQGFTMIELIMVIVILGVLAAVAMPRFFDLSTDARISKMQAALGAIKSGSAIAHSAYLVAGTKFYTACQHRRLLRHRHRRRRPHRLHPGGGRHHPHRDAGLVPQFVQHHLRGGGLGRHPDHRLQRHHRRQLRLIPAGGDAVKARAAGFTLVELVAILSVVGILAAVAAPRFFSANTYAGRGFRDEAAAFLRYAQKRAIAARTDVAVNVESSGLTLCAAAGSPCSVANQLIGPDGQAPYRSLTPNGVTLSGSRASVLFDARGRPDAALTLTITGDSARTLTVEAETGYVH